MKQINQFITEYIIKKKLDKPIDSSGYKYHPQTKQELINNIDELLKLNIHDFNCIDTSAITDMSKLFSTKIIKFNDIDISEWNVSNVTNMSCMFISSYYFNCDLSKWDVSKVENMSNMFNNCGAFNCDLSIWHVTKVKNMENTFLDCTSFEGKGLENWDVSNVKNMYAMFYNCRNLICDLEKWNVNPDKCDVEDMFKFCWKLKNKPNWYQ